KAKTPRIVSALPSAVQELHVRGRVLDHEGQPVPDATVRTKNGAHLTKTDGNGNFLLEVPNYDETIVVSFIGFETNEVKAAREILIQLVPTAARIDEIVAVGYGTTQRRDLTGAVSTVNMEGIRDVPFASLDQALTGKAAGVQVVQADGSPGGVAKIRVRGGTSLLGGNDPLYIIDGVQVT